MKRYEAYKDSGVDWIGEIPEGWEVIKMKYLFKDTSIKNQPNLELLSVTQDQGVVPRDLVENRMVMPTGNLESFKVIEKGDFAISLRSFEGGLEYSKYKGIVSPAYTVLKSQKEIHDNYYKYLFKSISFIGEMQLSVVGIREGKNISYEELRYSFLQIPPHSEQTAIAVFLDEKTAKIDQTIGIRQKEIELLKERRQILIQQAVTKGLDASVPMKDSGVDWIGEIPEHWEVRKLKQVCKININSLDERTNPNYEFEYIDIGSVTYENGIINKEFFLFKNAPSRARRIAKEGDTIVSTVRTYLKAIDFVDKSKSNYIFSTGFAVLEPNNEVYPKYLFSFIKSDAFTEQVSVNSKGMSYPAINSTELGAQKVLYLPYEEQVQIVSYLEDIEAKIAKAITLKEQEIEKLKEYKTVLIDQVVTGKVRVIS